MGNITYDIQVVKFTYKTTIIDKYKECDNFKDCEDKKSVDFVVYKYPLDVDDLEIHKLIRKDIEEKCLTKHNDAKITTIEKWEYVYGGCYTDTNTIKDDLRVYLSSLAEIPSQYMTKIYRDNKFNWVDTSYICNNWYSNNVTKQLNKKKVKFNMYLKFEL